MELMLCTKMMMMRLVKYLFLFPTSSVGFNLGFELLYVTGCSLHLLSYFQMTQYPVKTGVCAETDEGNAYFAYKELRFG